MEPDNAFLSLREFTQRHLVWILGLVPFVLAAIKIGTGSLGNPQVYAYLVHELDIVGLVLSVALPLVPVTIFWVWLVWWDRRRRTPKDERINLGIWPFVVAGFALSMLALFQISYAIPTIIVLAFIPIDKARSWSRNRKLRLQFGADDQKLWRTPPYNALVIISFLALQALTPNTPWLPAEVISITHQPSQLARVVSVNDVFLTFINGRDQITIVRSKDVLARQPCYVSNSALRVLTMTVGEFVASRFKDYAQPECPK